jgi:hypothetical protein
MVSEIRRTPTEKCLTGHPPFFIQGVLPQSIGGRPGVVSLHVVLVELVEGPWAVGASPERVASQERGSRHNGASVGGLGIVPEARGSFSSNFAQDVASPPDRTGSDAPEEHKEMLGLVGGPGVVTRRQL